MTDYKIKLTKLNTTKTKKEQDKTRHDTGGQ